ncbi:YjbH domain-containing protein, partial [Idiomarina abyssalis]
MKRIFIALFAIAVLAESGVASAETKQVQFEGPVRLKQALNAIEKQGLLADVYWPAVRLVKTDEAAELERKKQNILLQLAELEAYWRGRRETDKADAALMLRGQIKGWQLGQQYWGHISIEQARQNLADNPLLPEGSYSLVLTERPEHIYVYGLVSKPGKYEFYTGKTVANWLNSIEEQSDLLDGHNKNIATVVSVDDEQPANWAYYKQSDTELMPGNILWLGFEPNQLPPKYKSLNDDIRGLLKHFVADTSVRSATNAPVYQVNAAPTSEWHWSRRDLSPSYNDYGSVGLLQNPTARMMEEGAFAITYSDMEEYRRYTVNLQLLPWLETTAFYTEFPNKLYSDV